MVQPVPKHRLLTHHTRSINTNMSSDVQALSQKTTGFAQTDMEKRGFSLVRHPQVRFRYITVNQSPSVNPIAPNEGLMLDIPIKRDMGWTGILATGVSVSHS